MVGAEDWLEWTCSVEWGEGWDDLRKQLDNAKSRAAENHGRPGRGGSDMVMLNGWPAAVSPGGARLGRGHKGPYLPWRFTWQGMVFLLADRPEPHATLPSLSVRADGMGCLMSRVERLWHRAQNLIAALGGRIVRERLSRVDLCLDLPGVSIEPFCMAYLEERYVTRAKAHRIIRGSGGSTLYIGGAPQLRVYDKLAELNASRDAFKRGLMAHHRWSGIEPDEAIRVEFQLGREPLTSRGVDSVRDYFDKRADLARYLCHDWIRFTRDRPDRTNTTRAALLSVWEQVQQGFADWTGRPVGQPLDALSREACDVSMLFKSAVGMMLTAAARQGQRFATEDQLLLYGVRHLTGALREIDWRERMRRKAAEYVDEG